MKTYPENPSGWTVINTYSGGQDGLWWTQVTAVKRSESGTVSVACVSSDYRGVDQQFISLTTAEVEHIAGMIR